MAAEREPLDVPNDDSYPSIDSEAFRTDGIDVRVSNADGYLCKIRLLALIDIPPSELYAVHTVPDTSNVFRAIDGVRARKIHLDTPDRREIYVEQTSTVGALWFRKTFTTALNVTELPKEVAMTFDLAQPGLMSKFQGKWKVSTVTPARFRELTARRQRHARWHLSIDNPRDTPKSLMEMEQDVCPAIAEKVPPVFYGIMRHTCANAMRAFFWDATALAELRYVGLSLEEILSKRVHGRGGLIRRKLCDRKRFREHQNDQRPLNSAALEDGPQYSEYAASQLENELLRDASQAMSVEGMPKVGGTEEHNALRSGRDNELGLRA